MERAYINGIVYDVIQAIDATDSAYPHAAALMAEQGCSRWVVVRRPKGSKEYFAKDFGPHPVYGENRRYVLLCENYHGR